MLAFHHDADDKPRERSMDFGKWQQELLDRMRRMETRLTSWMISNGAELTVDKPEWHEGMITIPSMMTSLKDILAVIPDTWADGSVVICFHGKMVARITKSQFMT